MRKVFGIALALLVITDLSLGHCQPHLIYKLFLV